MSIRVAKFGGTSLADEIQFEKVKTIIELNADRKYVVPSAPGKRFSEDNKITDLLYLVKTHKEQKVPYDQIFGIICERFTKIRDVLNIDIDIESHLDEVKKNIDNGASADYIASRGEYLNGILLASYLDYTFVDAAEILLFDENGKFLDEESNVAIKTKLSTIERAVIPGFYGSTPDGKVKTFSRGGSDITGSLVSKALKVDMYENWTDVSGFLMADPRIVDGPKPIKNITYKELRELSYMGASVLHEDAVFPVREVSIPINIRNTNDPTNEGTVIRPTLDEIPEGDTITGIAGKKDFTVIAIYKNRMNAEVGFIRKILSILEDHKVSVEHLPSGIDTMSIVLSESSVTDDLNDIIEEIKRKVNPDSVDVYPNMALIATVGYGMSRKPGTAAKLFDALSSARVNIRMIDQGSSEINIIVGIENDDFDKAIKAIYCAFINS